MAPPVGHFHKNRQQAATGLGGRVDELSPVGLVAPALDQPASLEAQYDALGMFRADVIIPMSFASMIMQGLVFAYLYPRLFDTARDRWLRGATGFFAIFGTLAWSFVMLPVAAKYNMTPVPRFVAIETAFTVLQFAVTSALIALAWRDRASR